MFRNIKITLFDKYFNKTLHIFPKIFAWLCVLMIFSFDIWLVLTIWWVKVFKQWSNSWKMRLISTNWFIYTRGDKISYQSIAQNHMIASFLSHPLFDILILIVFVIVEYISKLWFFTNNTLIFTLGKWQFWKF